MFVHLQRMVNTRRRVAFFGGSFDPVHNGHLEMARVAVEQLGLDRVNFVPARQNPHKQDLPMASDADRLAMLQLATAGHPQFGIWAGELEREGRSYTVDTVEHVLQTHPNCLVVWLIGSDQLPDLHRWHRIEHLVTRVPFALVQRPGHPFEWPRIPGLNIYLIDNSLHHGRASTVRDAIAQGRGYRHWLQPEVFAYIRAHGLYGT